MRSGWSRWSGRRGRLSPVLLHVCAVSRQDVGKHGPVVLAPLVLPFLLRQSNSSHLGKHRLVLIVMNGIQNVRLAQGRGEEGLAVVEGSRAVDVDVVCEIVRVTVNQFLEDRFSFQASKHLCHFTMHKGFRAPSAERCSPSEHALFP